MFLRRKALPAATVKAMSPRMLAHLGDAVFHLFERERQLLSAASVSALHRTASRRASAAAQAELLDDLKLRNQLSLEEDEVVRRARNAKPSRQRRTQQAQYRKSTAFEALLGYLYLTNEERLLEILQKTVPESSEGTQAAD